MGSLLRFDDISVGQGRWQWQRDKSIGLNEALVPPIQVVDLKLFSCSIAGYGNGGARR
jgi:hypothetical protein